MSECATSQQKHGEILLVIKDREPASQPASVPPHSLTEGHFSSVAGNCLRGDNWPVGLVS